MKKEKKSNSEISKNLTNRLIEIHNALYEIDPTDHTDKTLIYSNDIEDVFTLLDKVNNLNFQQNGYENEFILQQILNYSRVHSQRIHRNHFVKMNLLIKKSKFYKELSEAQKNEFNKLLVETNIKTKPYYSEYEKIKLEKSYTKDEKDFIYNTLEYSEFHTWTFAFIVLAIRNKNNIYFKNALIDKKNNTVLDINKLESLIAFAEKFHNNYKKFINDKKKKNKVTDT